MEYVCVLFTASTANEDFCWPHRQGSNPYRRYFQSLLNMHGWWRWMRPYAAMLWRRSVTRAPSSSFEDIGLHLRSLALKTRCIPVENWRPDRLNRVPYRQVGDSQVLAGCRRPSFSPEFRFRFATGDRGSDDGRRDAERGVGAARRRPRFERRRTVWRRRDRMSSQMLRGPRWYRLMSGMQGRPLRFRLYQDDAHRRQPHLLRKSHHYYPYMPIGKVCLFVCLFVLYVRLRISPPRIKLAASNFVRPLIGVF